MHLASGSAGPTGSQVGLCAGWEGVYLWALQKHQLRHMCLLSGSGGVHGEDRDPWSQSVCWTSCLHRAGDRGPAGAWVQRPQGNHSFFSPFSVTTVNICPEVCPQWCRWYLHVAQGRCVLVWGCMCLLVPSILEAASHDGGCWAGQICVRRVHSRPAPGRPLSAGTTPPIPAALGCPLCRWLSVFMLTLTTGLATCA